MPGHRASATTNTAYWARRVPYGKTFKTDISAPPVRLKMFAGHPPRPGRPPVEPGCAAIPAVIDPGGAHRDLLPGHVGCRLGAAPGQPRRRRTLLSGCIGSSVPRPVQDHEAA